MTKKIIKIAAYIRVSTDEQVQKFGLDAQKAKIKEYIKSKNQNDVGVKWELKPENIFQEEGYSGSLEVDERPQLKKLMEKVERKEVDAVMVYRIDRLFRNTRLLLETVEKIGGKEIQFISVSEPHFDTTAVGKLMFQIFAMLAEFERSLIMERTLNGKIAAAKKGRYVGGTIPFGYLSDENRVMQVHPEESKIVQKIFNWYNKGFSVEKIRDELKLLKIPRRCDLKEALTEKEQTRMERNPAYSWSPGQIRKILDNEAYIGRYYFKEIPLECPSIISEELFEKVKKKRKADRPSNRAKHEYLFSNKVYCGCCGRKMTPYAQKMKSGTLAKNYRCPRQKNTGEKCTNGAISERILETLVWDKLVSIISNPKGTLENLVEEMSKEDRINKLKARKEEVEAKLETLERGRANFLTLVSGELISMEEASEQATIYAKNKKDASEELEFIEAELATNTDLKRKVETLKNYSAQYKSRLKNLSYQEQRAICQLLIRKIIITKNDVQLRLTIEKSTSDSESNPNEGEDSNKWKNSYGGWGEDRTRGQLVKSQMLYH